MKRLLLEHGRIREYEQLEYADSALKPQQKEGEEPSNGSIIRTFIAADGREQFIDSKFGNDLSEFVAGKRVVTVDDSTVRGNTSRIINRKLWRSGAHQVHNRNASDKFKHPCFMGIDFPTEDELIARNKTDEELAEELNATTVRFLPTKKLKEIGHLCGMEGFCTACFTGEYPLPVNKTRLFIKTLHEVAAAD